MNENEMIDIDLPSLQSITFGTESLTESKEYSFDNPNSLEILEIGDDCFGSVQRFQIDGLNRLKSLKIGKKSFTQKQNSGGNDASKSFHILNCESLEWIEIGAWSFSDFGGDFELKNCRQLQSITLGRYAFLDSLSTIIESIE